MITEFMFQFPINNFVFFDRFALVIPSNRQNSPSSFSSCTTTLASYAYLGCCCCCDWSLRHAQTRNEKNLLCVWMEPSFFFAGLKERKIKNTPGGGLIFFPSPTFLSTHTHTWTCFSFLPWGTIPGSSTVVVVECVCVSLSLHTHIHLQQGRCWSSAQEEEESLSPLSRSRCWVEEVSVVRKGNIS